jgi:hypothetical protein
LNSATQPPALAAFDWFALGQWERSGDLGEARQEAARRIGIYLQEQATELDLSHLGLTTCPPLPAGVDVLRIDGNRLRALPMPMGARILRVDEATGQGIVALALAQDRQACTYDYSRGAWKLSVLPDREVGGWVSAAQAPTTVAQWRAFADEPGALDFGTFLKLLGDSPNRDQLGFAREVADWLEELAGNSELRAKTFEYCQQATSNCEDHAALLFNDLQVLRFVAQIEAGTFPGDAKALLECAKGIWRLGELRRVAAAVVMEKQSRNPQGAPDIDDVEIYQALYRALSQPLRLPVIAQQMRYAAELQQTDIDRACHQVLQLDDRFAVHLSNWTPWHQVLARWAPQAVESANSTLQQQVGNGEYLDAVDAHLEGILPGLREQIVGGLASAEQQRAYADAERAAGTVVLEAMRHMLFEPLTQDYLREHGLPPLAARVGRLLVTAL